jgi:hypothetical protein
MPDKPVLQRISVDVDDDTAARLKIKWRRELPWGKAYCIPRGMLEDYSAKARERLEALVNESMAGKGQVKHTGALLKELAQAGNRLYKALFHDPGKSGPATKIQKRLEGLTGGHRIAFSMGVPIHVPWGLVYDGDPEALSGKADDIDVNKYRNFWCIKYHVASVYYTVDPEGANTPLAAKTLRVHSIVNEGVFNRTSPSLKDSGGPFWDWMVERFGPPLHSQKEWRSKWTVESNQVGLLYFYSHADGTNIGLGSDTISANDLQQDLGESGTEGAPPCLVFVNGCSTAVGSPTGGFLEATSVSRFCGFIGAEASIPEVYALRFGSAFICELMRGERTVLEVMDALREQHWPLSLLYNVYCVPDLRIQPESTSVPPVIPDNFCDFDLGSKGI